MTALALSPGPQLVGVIESIGAESFGRILLAFLHELCGADHFAVFKVGQDSLTEFASGSLDNTQTAHRQIERYLEQQYWRRDPAIFEALRRLDESAPVLIKVTMDQMEDTELRSIIYPRIAERVVVCGRRKATTFGISVLRSDVTGSFSDADLERLSGMAPMLLSMLEKHAEMLVRIPNFSSILTSLEEIERCMGSESDLPRREFQVCARVLYGMSSVGIALDLGIGEESVKTYRKRAYQRMNIGCERELVTWYLACWARWKGHGTGLASEPSGAAQPLRH